MAIITVEFDTKNKTLVVKKDDKKLSDVSDVNFYKSYDDEKVFRASISQRVQKEDEGIVVMTYTMANEDGKEIDTVEEVKADDKTRESISKALLRRVSN